jgi:hypothetical protein
MEDHSVSFMLLYRNQPEFSMESLKEALQKEFIGAAISGAAEGKILFLNIKLPKGEILCAGLTFPYPGQVLKNILQVCHFSQQEKQEFHDSQSHIMLSYKGDEAAHLKFDALYRVISCLVKLDPNAIGVVNEGAMTAHPVRMMEALEAEKQELSAGKSMPFMSWMLWTGACVKYIQDPDTIWFVTKGNHQFGLPELAFKGGPGQGNSTMEIFNGLFSYMYFYKAKLAAGHTADFGDKKLKFSAVEEYADLFTGRHGTLVVNFR